MLGWCFGVAVGDDGTIYFSDNDYHVIRKVSNGHVTTLAGKPRETGMEDGKGEQARFSCPWGMCIASDGSLLVADCNNHSIRRVSTDGHVTTILGNGKGDRDGDLARAQLKYPQHICTNGNDIDVSSGTAKCVKKISQGTAVSLRFTGASGMTFLNGSLFTASSATHSIYEGESFIISNERHIIPGTQQETIDDDGHKQGQLYCFLLSLGWYWQLGTARVSQQMKASQTFPERMPKRTQNVPSVSNAQERHLCTSWQPSRPLGLDQV